MQRRLAYDKCLADLEFVFSHPDFSAPEHPYVQALRLMAEYAVFGVIDPHNRMLHVRGPIYYDSVVVAPVMKGDHKGGPLTLPWRLTRADYADEEDEFEFDAFEHGASGVCQAFENVLLPIISVAPHMVNRHPIVVGCTVAHELDHAYWWLRRKSRFKQYDPYSEESIAAQEVSANRLEQQILFAHLPVLYDEEYGRVSLLYADRDFERPYNPRLLDKLKKTVRVVAFINFMFDELKADIGVMPTADLITALKAQGLM